MIKNINEGVVMNLQPLIKVVVSNWTAKWYRDRGYDIPTHVVQLFANLRGKRVKNGIKKRVPLGTTILVKPEDLSPKSNQIVSFTCTTCGKPFQSRWAAIRDKISGNCVSCQAKKDSKVDVMVIG